MNNFKRRVVVLAFINGLELIKTSIIYFILFSVLTISLNAQKGANSINLAGVWKVKLDSLNQGEIANWQSTVLKGDTVKLPGTLDDFGLGIPNQLAPGLNNYVLSNLTRKHQYIGKAWYQKEIVIPQSWKNKNVQLTLERVMWQSSVFVDDRKIGIQQSLIGNHQYDLTQVLTPGKHLLTILVDNSNIYPEINVEGKKYPNPINKDMAHAYTNHTQIKWNGILGDMTLEAIDPNAPENLKIINKIEKDSLTVVFKQPNPKSNSLDFTITDDKNQKIYSDRIMDAKVEDGSVQFSIKKPENLEYWDEFNPKVYKAIVRTSEGSINSPFGYRQIHKDSTVLKLNGKRIFLRGNLECAIFPLTGHPPMQKEGWIHLINQAKNYGLNHLRFHSWCPPKAAFEAADEAGIYLQVELPHWSLTVGEDAKTTAFLKEEGLKILQDYGNHPSFIFMSMGNELQGDMSVLNKMTAAFKKVDNRHLYATTTFSFQRPSGTRPEPEDEFFVTQWTDQGWIRGQGIFNDSYPNFDKDYTKNGEYVTLPLISHEIGQYSVYPDLTEIEKYTGVLTPLNFMAVQNDLEKKGILNLANNFTHASGKLAAMLYKEEIERALKTASFDGFQLLQLQDFPGQGTALVGLLNAFWESKGIISPDEFRQFNSPMVPLLRFEKAVYENGESIKASIEVANFFKELSEQQIAWSVSNEKNKTIASGTLENTKLSIGNNQNLGLIEVPIRIEKAERWTVQLLITGTNYINHWPIWVYPTPRPEVENDIIITPSFEEAITALKKGGKVLLNPDISELEGIKGRFVPVFWSPVHFPDQPGTMGLLIDENHKAFADFPTGSFTEWQWWDLCIQSKSVSIDSLKLQPIVRSIDNFVTNRQLATLFEAKIGNGKLIFSAMDLHKNLNQRPVARQLKHSILNYMKSDAFDPKQVITTAQLNTLKIKNDN